MIAVNISVPVNDAGPALRRVEQFLTTDAVRNLVGYEGQRTVREHFQSLDETRKNKLGGKRSHYYNSARRGTGYYLEGEYVVVNVHQIGIALHYYGGTVTAGKGISSSSGGPTKFLTIPACAEAYGHRASDFDLVMVWSNRGPWALALAERSDRFTEHGGYRSTIKPGKIMFLLREEVTFAPDPDVLPTQDKIIGNAQRLISKAISRRFMGREEPPPDGGAT